MLVSATDTVCVWDVPRVYVTLPALSLPRVDALGTHLLRDDHPLPLPQLLLPGLHQGRENEGKVKAANATTNFYKY